MAIYRNYVLYPYISYRLIFKKAVASSSNESGDWFASLTIEIELIEE